MKTMDSGANNVTAILLSERTQIAFAFDLFLTSSIRKSLKKSSKVFGTNGNCVFN